MAEVKAADFKDDDLRAIAEFVEKDDAFIQEMSRNPIVDYGLDVLWIAGLMAAGVIFAAAAAVALACITLACVIL